MRNEEEVINMLSQHQSAEPSHWKENAEWRIANKSWLRYSQQIAMMMLDKMEELNLTQKKLSERMGCSQQYISKILKGQENLSLETIAKIESCLEVKIMSTNETQQALAFAAMCVDATAEAAGCSRREMYDRMKAVGIIHGLTTKLDASHTQSRERVVQELLETLQRLESK